MVVSAWVEGRPLTPTLPYGLVLEAYGDDLQIVEPAGRSFAGRLVVPFRAGRELRLFDLDVPSSGDFTVVDLERLWEAGQEFASWRSRLALTSRDNAFAEPKAIDRADVLADWHALELCAVEAKRLLNNWPTRIGRELRWVPTGIGGGLEDLGHTEREVARMGYLSQHEGRTIVSRSARWSGRAERLTLSAISSLAHEVANLVRTTLGEGDSGALSPILGPITYVGLLAATPSRGADPDPSSWPPPFTQFAEACMRVLTVLLTRRRGDRAVPLLDTDELFEAWLAVTVRNLIGADLRRAGQVSAGAVASWETDAITVDLRVRPTIGRATEIGQDVYRALVASALVPDVVITATRGDITEIAVLDAKAWRKMLPEDVLSESAKYLYGIRRVGRDTVPGITSVHIVSCAARPKLSSAADARIGFVHATPTAGEADMRSAVGEVLAALASAIQSREQEESLVS